MVEQNMSSSSPSSSSSAAAAAKLQGGSLSLDHEMFMWSANSWINSPLPARVAAAVASSNNCSCSSRCSSSHPQWVTGGVHNKACDLIARIATSGRIWSSGEWSPCTVAAPRDCCCLKDWPLQQAVWFSIHYHHGDTSVARYIRTTHHQIDPLARRTVMPTIHHVVASGLIIAAQLFQILTYGQEAFGFVGVSTEPGCS